MTLLRSLVTLAPVVIVAVPVILWTLSRSDHVIARNERRRTQ